MDNMILLGQKNSSELNYIFFVLRNTVLLHDKRPVKVVDIQSHRIYFDSL